VGRTHWLTNYLTKMLIYSNEAGIGVVSTIRAEISVIVIDNNINARINLLKIPTTFGTTLNQQL